MIVFADGLTFEGAHFLPRMPEGHKCKRLHGHNWTVRIECAGEPDPESGLVVDYYDVQRAWEEHVYAVLDHRLLNDVPGLENPTTENIAPWIWRALKPALPSLSRVIVRETPMFGCVYEGPQP